MSVFRDLVNIMFEYRLSGDKGLLMIELHNAPLQTHNGNSKFV